MSFMFNPYPYDDPKPVNRPKISDSTIKSIVSGTKEAAAKTAELFLERIRQKPGSSLLVAMDGYIGAQWDQMLNLLSQILRNKSVQVEAIDFSKMYKEPEQLEKALEEYLPLDKVKDPVLLYGKLFKGSYEDLLDSGKLDALAAAIQSAKSGSCMEGKVTFVFGCGCTIKALRPLYDYVFYFDVTPKNVILRARNGLVRNLGDETARPIKALLRRFYYVDFEVAGHLRWDLIRSNAMDYYIASDNLDDLKLIPKKALDDVMSALVRYPMRCKPVYLEGVWGGYYIKRLRNLPDKMRNCAWVFDLIPLEVSIVVEAGGHLLEFPFFTFIQKEGTALMGKACVEKFGGYFPIRFNYDDSYHSNGNMSIQVHSGHDYNVQNYDELGRQDESYYIIEVGHDAKTFVGFNDNVDADEFITEVKRSETEHVPVDYKKYVNYVDSKPGIQVMLPAGTIHSSGRNQLILEIGSLSIGSYTYKMYDYLRKDLDGVPRPIHTWHGEKVVKKERLPGLMKIWFKSRVWSEREKIGQSIS